MTPFSDQYFREFFFGLRIEIIKARRINTSKYLFQIKLLSCFYFGFLTFELAAGTFILIVFSQSRMEPFSLWLGLSRRSQQWAGPTVRENVSDKKGGSGAWAQVSGQQRGVQAWNRRPVPRQTAAGHPRLRSLRPAQALQRVDEECGTDRNFHHLRTQVSLIV